MAFGLFFLIIQSSSDSHPINSHCYPVFSFSQPLRHRLYCFTRPYLRCARQQTPRITQEPVLIHRSSNLQTEPHESTLASQRLRTPQEQSTMSSRSSYGSSYAHDKGASYTPRSSSPRSSTSTSSSVSQSIYANSAQSSRNYRYGNKPPVVHNGGGQSNDPNTSTSAPNSGYYN